MDIHLPHWLLVVLGAIAISSPFLLYNVIECGALHGGATAPFTHYQDVTVGLNVSAIGVYLWLVDYQTAALVLLTVGLFLTANSYHSLIKWYRVNPDYYWRLWASDKPRPLNVASDSNVD